jgi:4-amino-4-deoxychorismate lyase
MRGIVIELARHHHIPILEHNFNTETLLSADEVFMTNSIIGVWPVKQIETMSYRVGTLTQQLQCWLDQFKKEQGHHDL